MGLHKIYLGSPRIDFSGRSFTFQDYPSPHTLMSVLAASLVGLTQRTSFWFTDFTDGQGDLDSTFQFIDNFLDSYSVDFTLYYFHLHQTFQPTHLCVLVASQAGLLQHIHWNFLSLSFNWSLSLNWLNENQTPGSLLIHELKFLSNSWTFKTQNLKRKL